METLITAVVTGTASKIMSKSNGAQYVLMNCEITSDKGKGLIVAGTRTILNKDKVTKEIPEKGTEVVLYHSKVPSTTEIGKYQHFFEMSLGGETASNADLDAAGF